MLGEKRREEQEQIQHREGEEPLGGVMRALGLAADLDRQRQQALFEAQLVVHSAHIATYGERAADTFYVTDLFGHKLDRPDRLRAVEEKLLAGANAIETGDANPDEIREYSI